MSTTITHLYIKNFVTTFTVDTTKGKEFVAVCMHGQYLKVSTVEEARAKYKELREQGWSTVKPVCKRKITADMI